MNKLNHLFSLGSEYVIDTSAAAKADHHAVFAGLTAEQRSIVDHDPSSGQVIVVNAFAGTGKTTTCEAVVRDKATLRFLYIVFNKGMADEAKARFGSVADCRTTHSLALRFCTEKLRSSFRIVENLANNGVKPKISRLLRTFAQNHFATIEETAESRACKDMNLGRRDAIDAAAAWEAMKLGEMGFTHDLYLKFFCLHADARAWVAGSYDCAIIDEAQDTNVALSSAVFPHRGGGGGLFSGCALYLFGDQHQGIYQFRRAVNAMGIAERRGGAISYALTQSFRFGQTVADVANAMLVGLKGPDVLEETGPVRGMPARDTRIVRSTYEEVTRWISSDDDGDGGGGGDGGDDGGGIVAVVGRTNSGIFAMALVAAESGMRIHFLGANASKTFVSDMQGVLETFGHEPKQRISARIEEAKDNDDHAKACVLGLLLERGAEQFAMDIALIKRSHVPRISNADIALSTVHGIKGLEFDTVVIIDDFRSLPPPPPDGGGGGGGGGGRVGVSTEQINVQYVALTRARRCLVVASDPCGAFLTDDTPTTLFSFPRRRQIQRNGCGVGGDRNNSTVAVAAEAEAAAERRPPRKKAKRPKIRGQKTTLDNFFAKIS
jgi:F-box protein 18 (helicase)